MYFVNLYCFFSGVNSILVMRNKYIKTSGLLFAMGSNILTSYQSSNNEMT